MGYKINIVVRTLVLSGLVAAAAPGTDIARAQDSRERPVSVRVAILDEAPDFDIYVRRKFRMLDPDTGAVLLDRRGFRKTRVTASSTGITVGEEHYPVQRLSFIPERRAIIEINGRRYRDEINVLRKDNGQLLVINVIDLESYVKGVLYHEVSHRWPLEAIKTQAVATRTYAIYRLKTNAKQLYDVTSDIYSQVYGGRNSEKYRTNIAANRTRGEIIVYQDKVVPAYFHATCGGHTEDAGELWKHDLAVLKGRECLFCVDSPHYQWKKNYRSRDIQDKLNQAGHTIGLIKDIQVVERNPSGRIKTLAITDRDGKVLTIAGKDFRNIVGPNLLRSNQYDVLMQGYYFDLIGKGWGHGVGMCQWGARGMAQERYRYDEILKYYYPGVEIVNYQTAGPLGTW
jgi:stage II sporulation protein D